MGILQEAARNILADDLAALEEAGLEQTRALENTRIEQATALDSLRDEFATVEELRLEEYQRLAEGTDNLRETITELQLQLEDAGWTRLSGYAIDQFNRQSLGTIAELSRVLYLKNPLIQRGANVKRLYVWGQGVNVEAEDPDINVVIQDFIDDRRNRLELTSQDRKSVV